MITAIIQARMSSTRLPGKSLMKIQGKSLIWHVINRVKQSKYVEQVVLATSEKPQNKPLMKEAENAGAKAFAGDENDVLDRFYQAAKKFKATTIIRITGDCPLIDPEIIDLNIKTFIDKKLDYVHSGLSYPDGIGDCEVFSFKGLEQAWEKTVGSDREHVTPYFWKNPNLFKSETIENKEDFSGYILSVDHKAQLEAVNKIYAGLYKDKKGKEWIFHMKDVIDFVKKNPEVHKMTGNIDRSCPTQHVRDQNKEKFKKSLALLKKAKELTPCASQTYSKSYRYFSEGAAPAFLDHGKGSHVWDIDGNEYIDFVGALGAITVGYCNEEVNKAVSDQLNKGIAFSQSTALEVELAEKIIKIIPCAEMVRFVKNGSDATSAAVRLARAYTERDMIAFSGYHGYQDWYIGASENNRGVPSCYKELIKKFEYNNIDSLKKIFDENPKKVAAVIMEAVQDNGPDKGYLEAVKNLAHKNGALLIFDEVVTGFRIHLAGAQGLFKVTPDLAALGKGMGNGLSISAVVGKKEILKLIEKGAFISTTHGGEALSLAGSIATIKILERKGSYEHVWKLGKKLRSGLQGIIKKKGLENSLELKGLDVHFSHSFKPTGKLTALDLLSIYQQVMIENGILVLTTNTFCLAHTEEDIDKYLVAAEKALDMVKKAVQTNDVEKLLTGEKVRPVFKRNNDR